MRSTVNIGCYQSSQNIKDKEHRDNDSWTDHLPGFAELKIVNLDTNKVAARLKVANSLEWKSPYVFNLNKSLCKKSKNKYKYGKNTCKEDTKFRLDFYHPTGKVIDTKTVKGSTFAAYSDRLLSQNKNVHGGTKSDANPNTYFRH